MKRLSNVMTNEHFYAVRFFNQVVTKSGEILNIGDEFGAMLYAISLKRMENLGLEFNRENAIKDISELAEGYVTIPQMRRAFDELYKSIQLGDDYIATNTSNAS